MATVERDHEAIEQAIAAWPVEEQIALARQILERAGKSAPPQPIERSTWEALYGIASNGQEPPSDEQVAQWLDERRMNK